MAPREITDVRDAVHLDMSVTYDGRNTGTKTYEVPAGAVNNPVTVLVTGELVNGEDDGEVLRVYTESSFVDVELTYAATPGQYNGVLRTPCAYVTATTEWALLASSVSGLPSHLTEVTLLVDGEVAGPVTPSGGTATLPDEMMGAVIHAGVPYDCDFESLDMLPERSRKRTLAEVTVELVGSRGGYVGESFDALKELRVRSVVHAYGVVPLEDSIAAALVPSDWNTEGRCVYRQSAPLPTAIVAITRLVEFGG
jgi:hypothetical protein